MEINVKCYATLSTDGGCNYRQPTPFEIPGDEPVQSLLDRIDSDTTEVKTIFVNGRLAGPDTALADGDRVGLFPAVAGM